MKLLAVDGKQYFYNELTQIDRNTLYEVNMFFSRKCPFIYQASHFYENGYLSSVPDGQLRYLKASPERMRHLLFEAYIVYFLHEGNWSVNTENIYYYYLDTSHVMIKPYFTEYKISIEEYTELLREVLFKDDIIKTLRERGATLEEIKKFYSFFDNDFSFSSELFEGMIEKYKDYLPNFEEGHLSFNNNEISYLFTQRVLPFEKHHDIVEDVYFYESLRCIIVYCIDKNKPLLFLFTAIDLLFRSRQKSESVISLCQVLFEGKVCDFDEDIFVLLQNLDGIILSKTNVYFRAKNTDELLLYYHHLRLNPRLYFEELDFSKYLLEPLSKDYYNTKDFLKRYLPCLK